MATEDWSPPDGLRGPAGVIRLTASQLDPGDRRCPEFAALKARPQVWPRQSERRRFPPWEDFPLGLVMEVLDAVEFDGFELDDAVERVLRESRSPAHPGAAVWVRHACHAYVEASAWVTDDLAGEGVSLRPERQARVVQHGSAVEMRVLTAWGRWYASPDGAVREFRRLRISRSGDVGAPSTAAAAFVTATGLRAFGSVYRELPVEVGPDDAEAARVRVVEVVLDSEAPPKVLFDGSPEEARRVYGERARPVAADLIRGGSRRPGSDCADCKIRTGCEALPHASGLLGLDDRGTHRRTWSITTARRYQICPARAHLRDLHVPGGPAAQGPAIRRGVVVHEWLRIAHGRPGARPCSAADLPEGDPGFAAEFMTPEEYREARAYLLGHVEVCPLREEHEEIVTEPKIAAYDPAADVVVVADPDLIARGGGRVLYREQKTTVSPDRFGAEEALEQVPQLALAVLLIAHGVLGSTAGTVELEVMTPIGAAVHAFDAGDPAVLAEARRVIARLVRDWHRDVRFEARPGPWCSGCPVARWCPDHREHDPAAPIEVDGVLIDPRTGEVLRTADAVSGRAAAVSADLVEPEAEEVPF
ncbi:PD-(D/E)XK nuclease family protein [Actinomadura viridis]|uniref:PD-(D/E)XK nuclease family protein n=1 Tax=Actinomadura viridis TaxID=58110 RepID=UPI0036C102F5